MVVGLVCGRMAEINELNKHFKAIIDLLSDGTEREDIVRVINW